MHPAVRRHALLQFVEESSESLHHKKAFFLS
jgi:hypothetical protein